MEYILDVLLYLFVFVASATLIYYGMKLSNTKKKIGLLFVILGILIPSILAGIRYNVGTDYASYMKMFNNIEAGHKMYFRQIEPLSTLIITLSAHLHSSFLMFFSFSLITNVCFYLAFWHYFDGNKTRTTIAFLIYLFILFPTTLNAVRSSVAVSIITLILSLLIKNYSKKSIIESIVLLAIATLFHKSAILILLFVPVILLSKTHRNDKIKNKKIALWYFYILMSAIIPLIYVAIKDILPLGDYSRYLTGIGEKFSIPLSNILMSTPILLTIAYLYKNKPQAKDKNFDELMYYVIFYIPLSIAVGWLTIVGGLSRLSFVLEPLIIIIMSQLITLPRKTAKIWRVSAIICVSVVVSLMFIRNLNWSKALPYQTIFEKEISYATKN